jgi:hypothetical protein
MLKPLSSVLIVQEEATSDLIWREIELTKKRNQLSFLWNYAASGGYYIACNANTILKPTQLQDQLEFWNITKFYTASK